ncbi:5-amino-6-(D-ribitylamino)uracil--L-tyrosine 4-hydroxyphenyl transferase CofH [Hoeflea poritis]|uniref:FO synthase n=1 Tax=Hoeflea poritis TaxID=2993659 RepID=A0ABT4VVM8_9HYPH|nr:5-amino-6-(D-ribitylamino)uracil--L-tyrosine 4-hydroxyphenyl transferase CofH [Hoeflea poritis]MDA4848764.1 5-amino-6-(D-ribitylamino)uracil--L-tyrosine 4-hydroxyphenyl transferase CofH [Hoeflea poritis]
MNTMTIQYDAKVQRLSGADALALLDQPQDILLARAVALRDAGHGRLVSYSRKVFIPLTQLCRDVCHYCTFAKAPRKLASAYLSPQEVVEIAAQGKQAGCKEALFTLGDKPELRYAAARRALDELGYGSTLEYLRAMAELVFNETGLLPHLNPGIMSANEIASLRQVSVSMGIMLENVSSRLTEKGRCHHGSPDKDPALRLATIEEAGRQKVPFTSGILIGIGETRRERIESLLALRRLHDRHGHIQEIIIQNFRAKPGTRMAGAPEPDLADLQWTIAVARLIFGPEMSIQAPPNLSRGAAHQLVASGLNDWGGVSPVTPDHVNPEAPWPHLETLAGDTASAGKILVERLGVYPRFAHQGDRWLDARMRTPVLGAIDADGLARTDGWFPGVAGQVLPKKPTTPGFIKDRALGRILERAVDGGDLRLREIERLFAVRDGEIPEVARAADTLRRRVCGDSVSYVVTRNINYTNICYFKCRFCAFSKGKTSENLRGRPYDLSLEEITRRAKEAWDRGAVEVCLQGGIHPNYTGQTYLDILKAIKSEVPDIHVHAFSPLEIHQGAQTLGIPIAEFLGQLIEAGLGSLPGTAAEILDDDVRNGLCPDKINTDQWFDVVDTAHRLGLKTTSTIMFGHIDRPVNWARHLLRLREQQRRTGGFSEFVPLPFVHMEAPIYLKGASRKGPTWREALLMHAVARLTLNPHITNIQASWVKLGPEGLAACLSAGVNDIGGTLMNETITRSAGADHGQEMTPETMEALLAGLGRPSRQRTTLYGNASADRRRVSFTGAAAV